MTLRQNIIENIRPYRTVPPGSLLWLELPGEDDFIECREIKDFAALLDTAGRPDNIVVHLDTPEGDFEDAFCFECTDLIHPCKMPKPLSRNDKARLSVVEMHGHKRIEMLEKLIFKYAGLLVHRFREQYGYTGADPRIWVRWYTQRSWGGWRGFTISPASIYSPSTTAFRYRYPEYAHIEDRDDIGSFISMNPINHVKALVAHELAHFLQRHASQSNLPRLDYRTAHGEGWQYIYAITRSELNRYINR